MEDVGVIGLAPPTPEKGSRTMGAPNISPSCFVPMRAAQSSRVGER
jgi:hypothetical protein